MSYYVDYAPEITKPKEYSILRITLFSLSAFLIFCMLVSSIWPEGRAILGRLLFPVGSTTAIAAAEVFVDELHNGVSLFDALDNFCQVVIQYGDFP